MSKKSKAKAVNAPVPQDRDEASTFIAEIGRIDREITRIDANLKDALAATKADFEAAAQPLAERKVGLLAGLQVFCEANREALTGGKTKTISFAAGKASWRLRPPSVTLRGKAEDLVALLMERGLRRLLRHKLEINKEAILAKPDLVAGVRGISVASEGEDFIVEPFSPEGVEAAQ